jgi:ferritin-like metal-binding protein YciE
MTYSEHKIISLRDLFDYNICEFVSSEMQLKNILPKWIAIAYSLKLKNILDEYLSLVELNIKNSKAFINEEKTPFPFIKSKIMQAMVKQTRGKLNQCADIEIKDACLLAAIQSINHFKIFMYGTLESYAVALQMEKSSAIFQKAKANERQIDDHLCLLAETEINVKAKIPHHF